MKFASFKRNGRVGVGMVTSDDKYIVDLQSTRELYGKELRFKDYPAMPGDMLACIELGDIFIRFVSEILAIENNLEGLPCMYSCDEIKIMAPIPRPRKNIFCLGKNYAEHAVEMGGVESIPEHPIFFSKTPTSVIGHLDEIDSHSGVVKELDYEVELAVIIGRAGKSIKKEEADDYIFGYAVFGDTTARDLQRRHVQYLLGKSLDSSSPMGPHIVHKSAIKDVGNLFIRSKVNGELRQNSNTKNLIFDIPTLISTLSSVITLEPGDIIATGTPSGVGKAFKPNKLLKPGDVVELEIEKIGRLVNKVS